MHEVAQALASPHLYILCENPLPRLGILATNNPFAHEVLLHDP